MLVIEGLAVTEHGSVTDCPIVLEYDVMDGTAITGTTEKYSIKLN